MSLQEVLKAAGFHKLEGNCGELGQQQEDLRQLASNPSIKRILEVGFNAGHSAEVFLSANPTATLTSFELGRWLYTANGKTYIDTHFPGRHTLILGDSTQTLPEFIATGPEPFDLLFIDGGHEGEIPEKDLQNCLKLAHPNSIVILDDTNMPMPGKAWKRALDAGQIRQLGQAKYPGSRVMHWGCLVPTLPLTA
jgi:predicted O-methyltransferase YrrM